MSYPKTKAALIRHLESFPYLVWRCPAAVLGRRSVDEVEGRRFLRVQNRRLIFEVTSGPKAGHESSLDVSPKEVEWYQDYFLVRFPDSWADLKNERLVYFYLKEPFDCLTRESIREKAKEIVTKLQ